ncbi:MAG: hypothetical protein P0Y49_10895 [Candidatus Pedobacter colombiensis]|uniref:Methylamine utilisation protein MauE domain-containing protein n=1 Tax=Candidatus Pedobacter colombiensis TaxID=3121371 RepID=A0AAJ5WCQ2_9SPHI|nr:MauE/DoxX family redox-associated membrane protein [Pedobacter sp.]WEK21643.1 MAG: hypothetical protein P0Y49_10895 [Pedobacter sp.]
MKKDIETLNLKRKLELLVAILTVFLILFWLYAAGTQISDFNKFKGEMNNQVFSNRISRLLAYLIPSSEIIIATLLVNRPTRLIGMKMSLLLTLTFSTYIILALLNVYSRMPCNCAGLMGSNSTWVANLILNLIVTVVAVTGLIINLKMKERRTKVWIQ